MSRNSGPVTVIRAFNVLAGILDDAVRDRRLLTNPARGVKLPRKVKREHSYLTDEQVVALATEAGPDKGVIVLVLAYTGLRWGELAGLHVADAETLKRRIHVRRNAVNVGGKVEVGTPKTHERRTVPLPKFLIEPLAAACRGKGRDGIVFPAAGGSYAKSPGAHTWFDGAVRRCTAAAEASRPPSVRPTPISSQPRRCSHASHRTTCGTPRRPWRCRQARTSRRFSGPSATSQRR
jgi:integrase